MSQKNLIEIISAQKDELQKGIYFFNKENIYDFINYKDLYNLAIFRLGQIQQRGLKYKDSLIFQIDNNKEFVITFWACVLGGIIPIPLTVGFNSEHINKLNNVFNITNNSPIMLSKETEKSLLKRFDNEKNRHNIEEMKRKFIYIEDLDTGRSLGKVQEIEDEDIAFIQFSSGSTGTPKGVVLSHKNLITNISDIISAGKVTNQDVSLSWLPLTHDLGIIGFHISPLYLGINQILMSSKLFVHKPLAWIDAVSKFRASMICSPNFGYKYFLSNYRENEENEWDLSNVKLIFNGAEPIDVDLAQVFLRKLAKYNLSDRSMYTVYGMAEASLAISFPRPNSEIKYLSLNRKKINIGQPIEILDTNDLYVAKYSNNGYPLAHCSVRIVNDDMKILDENYVGNIQIKGDNVTRFYYNNEQYTKEIISSDGWLSTGDLGFLNEGCIFVTGRKKDLIIINGLNYYAHDIERICTNETGLDIGKVIVGSVIDNKDNLEKLIIFVNYRGDLDKFITLSNHIKNCVVENVGIEPKYIIPTRKTYKTTSGKVQRYKYLQDFYNSDYDEIIQKINKINLQSKNVKFDKAAVVKSLLNIIREQLDIDSIGLDDNIMEFGVQSIKLVKIHSLLSEIYPNILEISDLYAYPTISKLAEYIVNSEKIELLTNKFPLSLLENNSCKSVIDINVDNNTIIKLNNVSVENNLTIDEILAAIYIYLVSISTQQQNVAVNFINDDITIKGINFDLSNVSSIDQLYKHVRNNMESNSNKTYPLSSKFFKKDQNAIAVAFVAGSVNQKSISFDCFDLLLKVKLSEESNMLTFDFNNYFLEDFPLEFVQKYNNILAQI